MPSLTYDLLQAGVADYLARPDLANEIQGFIGFFEYEANRTLRVRQMETVVSLDALSSGETPLPIDYLSWRRATYIGTPNRVLEYVQPDILHTYHPVLGSISGVLNDGIPSMFTIERNSVVIRPQDASVSATSTSTISNIQFDYYQAIPQLSAGVSTGTNWLLTDFPDCYIAGALTEAYAFQKDYDQAGFWRQRRDTIFESLRIFDQRTRGPSAVRPMMLGRIP